MSAICMFAICYLLVCLLQVGIEHSLDGFNRAFIFPSAFDSRVQESQAKTTKTTITTITEEATGCQREREERLIPTDLQRATYLGGQPNITA
ncbi:hypothetical protein VN97_g4566 [Penicillium thymicola]|uniref:Secreted protein n=1 Tax=Penicillium thymicola TaxID=293382 RepID=A0AAI9TK19_PENTH|nr:hypothetical protein VN97_g4566 [Penicillium thymicola]